MDKWKSVALITPIARRIQVGLRSSLAWVWSLWVGVMALVCMLLAGRRRMWQFFAPFWGSTTLSLLGVRLQVIGDSAPLMPGILVSNHCSSLDVLVLPVIMPKKSLIVAKRELLYFPFLGWAFAFGGAFLVKRGQKNAIRQMQQLAQQLPTAWSVVVFAEGRRNDSGSLLPFKRGAFYLSQLTQLPLIPVGIAGTSRCGGRAAWTAQPGLVTVVIGSPHPPPPPDDEAAVDERLAQLQTAVAQACAQAQTINQASWPVASL